MYFCREPFVEAAKQAELEGMKIDFEIWSGLIDDSGPEDTEILMRSGDMKKVA